MRPTSTYRVQLHGGFGFGDATRIAPYLSRLGTSHLYSSPFLQAAPGSTHGYDVVDPHQLNGELGGEAAYRSLVSALRANGLGQVLDIVPNHMAVAGRANRWWWEVLEDGPSSPYAKYFDIDWGGPNEKGMATVLVPILSDHYGRAIETGRIRVDRHEGSLLVRYEDHELPLSPRTYDEVLEPASKRAASGELAALAHALGSLPHARRTDTESVKRRQRRKELLSERLAALWKADPSTVEATDAEIDAVNADPDRLDSLLQRQNYRLAFWRTASDELDYRRFFNIDTLVGVRVEDPRVFEDTHRRILDLVAEGAVAGLRVDHVDGLRDPLQYLERLHERTDGVFTIVEKILGPDETLPDDWPVDGTSGYDFLIRVGNLFIETENEGAMTGCYERFTGERAPFDEVVHQAKRQVVVQELASEVDRLARVLGTVCDAHRRHRDRTRREEREALGELLVAFPVYRSYAQPGRPPTAADTHWVSEAVRRASTRRPDIDPELFEFLGQLILLRHVGAAESEFAARFAQVCAPVMAKGVEDTAFYRYNRLVSLNEVGGAPDLFGRPVAEFHADTQRTATRWPETMLTLSTHDTKRSADVRARIHLLSELPGPWEEAVGRFAEINEIHRHDPWPDRNTEYLLYQTVIGTWPINPNRLIAYMQKATREAKVHTSWTDPVAEYDDAIADFTGRICADARFVTEVERFMRDHRIVIRGRINSLSQVTLLLTCPGVPDVYQGSELWDFSLVDPDNRRPVDFTERAALLESVSTSRPRIGLGEDDVGVWKLWLLSRLLSHRRENPHPYRSSSYEPLHLDGLDADTAIAFTRGDLAVVVPRLLARQETSGGATVALGPGRWTDVLTGEPVREGRPRLADLLSDCPVSVLARG